MTQTRAKLETGPVPTPANRPLFSVGDTGCQFAPCGENRRLHRTSSYLIEPCHDLEPCLESLRTEIVPCLLTSQAATTLIKHYQTISIPLAILIMRRGVTHSSHTTASFQSHYAKASRAITSDSKKSMCSQLDSKHFAGRSALVSLKNSDELPMT